LQILQEILNVLEERETEWLVAFQRTGGLLHLVGILQNLDYATSAASNETAVTSLRLLL
jgi:hypothetical protein